jgi:hypothetical protein
MRVDFYTFIHKAQRFHLFRLSEEIGMTDFTVSEDANKVAQEVLQLIEHLKDHAQNEKHYIHPLYQALGATGEHFDKEHENLDAEIQKIENVVLEKRWNDLYQNYTRFLGIYLLHLDEEEAAQRDILWTKYQDGDLAAVFMRFKAERPSHLANSDFVFMLPSLSIPELTQMFRGMKASVPVPVFQGACETASKILEPNKWQAITKMLE